MRVMPLAGEIDRRAAGLIVLTDETCVIHGRKWPGIPTLVWPEGYDEDASDYLRERVVTYGVLPASAEEYAKVLRIFMRRCRQAHRDWIAVDDAFLTIWREEMRSKKLSASRINYCLTIVFNFYLWAEQERRLKYHVGAYARADLPAELADVRFPISAQEVRSRSSNGQTHVSWRTPLLLKVPRSSQGSRHTPTEDEIKRFHEEVSHGAHATRNSLIASWIEETGARPSEALRLKRSHLPSWDELYELIEEDRQWEVKIPRKGDSIDADPEQRTWGNLQPPPDLLMNTLMYIEQERQKIVAAHRADNIGYAEPEEVFLSEKYTSRTRGVLQTDSLTAIGVAAFRSAGVKNAGPHRFRARFAVRLVEELVDSLAASNISLGAWSEAVETLMTMASERMSHMSPQSIRPYIHLVLHRRLRNSDARKAGDAATRLRQLELREAILVNRLNVQAELQSISCTLRDDKQSEAVAALRALANSLEASSAAAQTSEVE